MSVFAEKGTETDKSVTAENWKTGRHLGTVSNGTHRRTLPGETFSGAY